MKTGKTEEQKAKIKLAVFKTKERRSNMACKVIQCKVDRSSLSKNTIESLQQLFLEGKWLYNSILASGNIADFDTKINEVQIKNVDGFEPRSISTISAQMKQGIHTRVFNSMSILSALKQQGVKIGKLRFKSELNSIPLKQHTKTFTIFKKSNRVKIQNIKIALKVNGLHQLPKNHEIANANLVKHGKDFYVHITIYVPKEQQNVPDRAIGIDFGCETQLTLSTGEKIQFQAPVSPRIKKLDRALARKEAKRIKNQKRSNNHMKVLALRQQEYRKLTNKRKDIQNKIVHKLTKNYRVICFQDESIKGWQASGHGKKIQFSAIGGIISALKNKAVTPVVLSRFYPSSQTCFACEARHKMHCSERQYICTACGYTCDRDVNAAKNMEKEGLRQLKILAERKESAGENRSTPVEITTAGCNSAMNCCQVGSTIQEATVPHGQ